MNMRISPMSLVSEGRYLTKDEQEELLAYAAALPKKIRYADLLEQKEGVIIGNLTEEMKRRYPNFAKFHDQAWGKCQRDTSLVLRYDVQAMVFDDMKMLDDKLLYWLRTILSASNMTPKFVSDCYTILRDQVKAEVSAEAFAALQPYLQRNIDVLSDFPEPATPAV